ncbi:MAG: tetratricopeptide repeat protein [Phycisphaerae bacterium]
MPARRSSKHASSKPAEQKKTSPVVWVLLAATVLVIGITIYIVAKPGETPPAPPTPDRPQLADRVVSQARGLIESGRPADAIPLMQAYVRSHPQDATVRPLLAEVQLRTGMEDEAEKTILALLQQAPESAKGHFLRSLLLQMKGDPAYKRELKLAAESPGATARILAAYGMLLMQEDQKDQAAEYLQRAVQAEPSAPDPYVALAQLRLQDNQFESAVDLLSRAQKIAPDSVQIKALLADAQKNLGQYSAAAEVLQTAIASEPDNWLLMMEYGKVLTLMRDYAAAAKTFAKASEYEPVAPEAAFRAARCYYFLDEFAEAMKYIDTASAAKPGDPKVESWVERIELARFGRPKEKTGAVIVPSVPQENDTSGTGISVPSPLTPATRPSD